MISDLNIFLERGGKKPKFSKPLLNTAKRYRCWGNLNFNLSPVGLMRYLLISGWSIPGLLVPDLLSV